MNREMCRVHGAEYRVCRPCMPCAFFRSLRCATGTLRTSLISRSASSGSRVMYKPWIRLAFLAGSTDRSQNENQISPLASALLMTNASSIPGYPYP